MKEFVSQLEELMEAEEILFPATPGFGNTYKKFLGQAIAHPAKMNTQLLEFLIDTFTVEGETVLDPMSGSGSTGVVAALHGRNAVCVELEKKFFKWMEQARRKVECQQTLSRKGKITNVLGDARHLSTLLSEADVVVTSPPYSQSLEGTSRHTKGGIASRDPKLAQTGTYANVVVTSPPYADRTCFANLDSRKDFKKIRLTVISKERMREIGAYLRQKRVDKGLTQKEVSFALGYGDRMYGWLETGTQQQVPTVEAYQKLKVLLGLDDRFDAILLQTKTVKTAKKDLVRKKIGIINYSEDERQIGNLRHGKVDVVVTSPPYEEALGAKAHSPIADKIFTEKGLGVYTERGNKNNIGNLAKETYLQAMLTVYQQMHSVLKPEGKAIIIIKPFIRNKKVVDLPYQTWLLLKRAGFKLTHLLKLRLKQQSFWRILYHRKYPKVAQIKHEYVLVTQKLVVANPLVVNGTEKEKI